MTYLNKFPEEMSGISDADCSRISQLIASHFQTNLKQLQINNDLSLQLNDIYIPLAAKLASRAKQQPAPLIIGLNGAQGSGKSTLCTLLETILREGFGLRTTTLSIDDLYSTRKERKLSGQTIHPLLATRGVPGTHDIKLGSRLIKQLSVQEPGHEVAIPVFDKAIDDRIPIERWRKVIPPLDLILFEGWCVGARPQEEALLNAPVNRLEADEDSDGRWRKYVNQRLKDDYAELFNQLDLLIMLQVPDMESVLEWRSLQERKLAVQKEEREANKIMGQIELERFIMHYERLTRHMLSEMPEYADIVLRLNREHLIDGLRINSG